MENLVKAGIINTETGEIVETISCTENQKDMRLRCRELNREHHGDINSFGFMTFSFTSLTLNLDAVRKRLSDQAYFEPVRIMFLKYNVPQLEKEIEETRKIEQDFYVAKDAALNALTSGTRAYEAVEIAIDDELLDIGNTLEEYRSRLIRLNKRIERLEEEQS